MQALVNGTIGSYSAALVHVRTQETDRGQASNCLPAKVQILINDVARAMIGVRRADRMNVAAVLDKAKVVSLNRSAFRSAALLAWEAMNSTKHPLAKMMQSLTPDSRTRAGTTNALLPVPPRVAAVSLVITNMVKAWNFSLELRSSQSKSTAKRVIRQTLRQIPI